MRTQLCVDMTRKQAKDECPWACVIVKVDAGYLCFESQYDYATWKAQR